MENHKKLLDKLCRVCGKRIICRPGYTNPKQCSYFIDVLQRYLNILPNEDENVFPKGLCNSCKNRMSYIRTNSKDYDSPTPTALFQPHTDLNCMICSSSTTSRKRKGLTLKELDNSFSRFGYIKLPNQNEERIYASMKYSIKTFQPYVEKSVLVKEDFSWSLSVLGKNLNEHLTCSEFPAILTNENLNDFCETLKNLKACPGNKDFIDVINDRIDFKEPFPDATMSGRIAWAEASSGHTPLVKDEFDVIRSASCLYLIEESQSQCESCSSFRKNLSKYRKRVSLKEQSAEQRVDPSSSTQVRLLKIDELEQRLKNTQQAKRLALNQLAKKSNKLESIMKKQGVESSSISSTQHELFKNILEKKTPVFEEGSMQWLLWMQQAEHCSKKDSRGMRWHPLIIRWCMSIYSISPAAYKHIASKQNKFLKLPHVNTLKAFINNIDPTSGFNFDILAKIVADAQLESLEEYQKNVCLSFDEIRIKSGLVYKRSSGKLVGYTEMGQLNDELKKLNDKDDSDDTSNIASYVIVLMIRGLFTSLCSPIAYFPSTGFRGEELCPVILEATRILEALSFKVRCWTSDGAAPNRKLYQIVSSEDDFFFSRNIFDEERKIFFISDPPHLSPVRE